MRRFVARSAGALVAVIIALMAASPRANAEYPDRVVRIELGFPSGGSADILARWYADKLQQLSGGHFIV
jgi:tripartite-type tricarboxylate transporter receptor subunit TctC